MSQRRSISSSEGEEDMTWELFVNYMVPTSHVILMLIDAIVRPDTVVHKTGVPESQTLVQNSGSQKQNGK